MPVATPIAATAIIAVAAGLLVVLEQLCPYEKRQRLLRPGFWTDLFWYTLVQNWVLGWLIGAIIVRLDAIASGRLHILSGWTLAAQAVLFLVSHDLYIYWFHRLQHHSPILWRIHEAHHSTADVDWLSGTRSHPLEILVNQTMEFAPLALLGAAPQIWYFKVVIDAVWGMYIHSNIDVKAGWLQYILNGPQMHRWHHATEVINVNFATKLAVWDWMFGTAHLPAGKPQRYGLVEPGYPSGYFAQTLNALRLV